MTKGEIDGMDLVIMRDCISKRSRATGTQPPFDGYVNRHLHRKAHTLVRHGYMSREQFSEQVRPEPRFYWWAFNVTEKGRKELADMIDQGVNVT